MNTTDKKIRAMLASYDSMSDLIAAGYNVSDLRAAGYGVSDLIAAGYSVSNLRAAGYSASALIAAGYSASDLIAAGYSVSVLRAAGCSVSDLKAAGYSASALIAAGYSVSVLRAAGCSVSDLRAAGYGVSALIAGGYGVSVLRAAGCSVSNLDSLDAETPTVEKPYTKIWQGIQDKKLKHNQSTFGPKEDHETDLCKTQMCTAGHLVNMGGALGYALKNKYGFTIAARLIHEKSHPGWPCQNFGRIEQSLALDYLEVMAEHEAKGTVPDWGKK